MDRIKESSNDSLQLLVAVVEGVESLEQGLCKKAAKAIQKSLAAMDARNRKLGMPTDFERQFRKQLTKGKKMKIRIIKAEVEKYSFVSDPGTHTVFGKEERTWCNGKQHIKAMVSIQGFVGWPSCYDTTKIEGTKIHKIWAPAGEIETSQCDCCENTSILLEVEAGSIPEGFATLQVLEVLGAARKVGKGEILAFTKGIYSSDVTHTHDIVCRKEGEIFSDGELSRGKLLSDGESVILKASIYCCDKGKYEPCDWVVRNSKGRTDIRPS